MFLEFFYVEIRKNRVVLSREKYLFMVQEGVTLGHIILRKGLEVDIGQLMWLELTRHILLTW